MFGFVLGRLLRIVPMLLAVGTALFLLLHATPGGPIVALAGEFADADTVADIERRFGLDRPLHVQYLKFLAGLARGDLGESWFYGEPVLQVLQDRLPATLILVVPSLLLAAGIGVPLGILAARSRRRGLGIMLAALLAFAVPSFWLGHLLRMAFSVEVQWFPVQGMTDARSAADGLRQWLDIARHAVLPVATLTLHQLAYTVLLTRSAIEVERRQPYFMTALAKGNGRRRAEYRHALPNGSPTIVTLFANRVGWFLAGAVLVEVVFAWPGFGQLADAAIRNRDFPLVIGIVLAVTCVTLLANLVADIVYMAIDPRILPHRGARA
ncbi:ABC transporter permease [Halovulum marinum]|uniref:ABC transporter permease n=1 Tax=Halovulum marinum TaxID=2662447 RepID=UPI002D78C292|nr:ABC transporter permease [Halovulum marinum]